MSEFHIDNITPSTPYRLGGIEKTLEQWCNLHGISWKLFSKRVRDGWSIKKALKTRRPTQSAIGRKGKNNSPWKYFVVSPRAARLAAENGYGRNKK